MIEHGRCQCCSAEAPRQASNRWAFPVVAVGVRLEYQLFSFFAAVECKMMLEGSCNIALATEAIPKHKVSSSQFRRTLPCCNFAAGSGHYPRHRPATAVPRPSARTTSATAAQQKDPRSACFLPWCRQDSSFEVAGWPHVSSVQPQPRHRPSCKRFRGFNFQAGGDPTELHQPRA